MPIDIPGYEVIDFRLPVKGDLYIANDINRPQLAGKDHGHMSPYRLIVRKKFEWPTWLKAKFIAMDECGEWYAYVERPEICRTRWASSEEVYTRLTSDLFDMQLPTCNDWTKSLMENPHV